MGLIIFVKKNLKSIFEKGKDIDVIMLGCTHYPLLNEKNTGIPSYRCKIDFAGGDSGR